MYNLLIVDDEPAILNGLAKIIKWEEFGINTISKANNGIQALTTLSESSIDILITDVRMPEMNGIELLKQIRDKHMNTKVIVLSGYDDFYYVKEAAKLGIENYLLKPVDENELVDTILSIINKIEQENALIQPLSNYQYAFIENIAARWLLGTISSSELRDRMHFLNVDISSDRYLVCIIKFLQINQSIDSLRYMNDLLSISSKIFNENQRLIYLQNFNNFIPVLCMGNKEMLSSKVIIDLFEKILSEFRLKNSIDLIICIGSIEFRISDVSRSYSNALSILDYYSSIPPNTVIDFDFFKSSISFTEYPIDFKPIQEDIKLLNKSKLKQDLLNICDVFPIANLTKKELQILGFYLLHHIFNGLELSEKMYWNEEYATTCYNDSFELWIYNIIDNYVSKNIQKEESISPMIKHIIEYINQNYTAPLSLKSLSNKFNINPAYLGQQFKKATGCLFSSYLNSLRLNNAKNLLSDFSLRENDIALRCGYSSVNYFLSSFKKATGMYPSQYRKQLINNNSNAMK